MGPKEIPRDGPAVLVFWDIGAVTRFVNRANDFDRKLADMPPYPSWLPTQPPHLTTLVFTTEVFRFLRGGLMRSFETMLIARNAIEFADLKARVTQVENDPFILAIMQDLHPANCLATLAVVKPTGLTKRPEPLPCQGVVFR